MLGTLRNRLQFLLERFLVRGPLFRLLFVIGIVVGVSVVGGLAVAWTGQFDDPWTAMWWAFLRLSDPGYLGDDKGTYVRSVSTLLTVAGYVLFLGAMIAIMTQWLNAALRRLENGLTPIGDRNHFVVVGWTTRTSAIVRELLLSTERVRRFLQLRGARSLNVVVMAEEVDAELQQDLRERVGSAYRSTNVILRSGSPLRVEHLRRVAALQAGALLLPAPTFDDPRVSPDTQTIKTLLSLWSFCREHDASAPPLVVAELLDGRNRLTARRAYPGPLQLVETNRLVSSLICQNIRHPGLSHVFAALLTHGEGSELYARDCPEGLVGMRFGDLADAYPQAILLGVVRREGDRDRPQLNPSDDLVLRDGDRLVLVAEEHGYTSAPDRYAPKRSDRGEGEPSPPKLAMHRRILLLGWSHHVPTLLQELDTYTVEQFEIVLATIVPIDQRSKQIAEAGFVPQRISVRHVEIDLTVPGQLATVDPASFDNIVFIASDRVESEEADARTIVGHLLLREILADDDDQGPAVLVELAEPENLALFQRGSSEVLIPAMFLSHMMAQIALRAELRVVFEDLFGPEGPEIFFRPAAEYGLRDREVDFATIRDAVAGRNETALGLRLAAPGPGDDEVLLNPPRDRRWMLRQDDELVVVSTYAS